MLKRLFLLLAPAAFLITVATEASTPLTREVVIHPQDVRLELAGDKTLVTLPDGVHALPMGEPDLPLVGLYFALPSGTQAGEVRVVPLETHVFPGVYRLTAVTHAEPGKELERGPVREGLDLSEGWYPRSPVIHAGTAHMRGVALATTGVSPFSWNPATGELSLMTRFRVEITLEAADPKKDLLVMRRESREGLRTFNPVLGELTGDSRPVPERLAPQVNSGAPFAPTFRPSTDGSAVDMVIITDSAQEAEYQRLADYKTQLGRSTVVRTTDWIQANYPLGVDLQETIRNFIADAVSNWGTAWIILGGDTDVVPVRLGFTNFFGQEEIPTDLYYSALDGNWNADGDAVFGEGFGGAGSPGDDADVFPDVWVGRMTSNNITEAQNLVDKVLAYQQTPSIGYQNDYLFAGEVLFPQFWAPGSGIQFDGAGICEDVIDTLQTQHIPIRLYENYTEFPGASPETKAAVVNTINNGVNLFHHVGHGYINTMSVGIGHETLMNSDAENATNGNELFMLYAINCTSCAIDFNCIAEAYLRNPGGGAISVVGSTRLDFPSTGRLYQNEFFHLLFQNEETEMGKTMALSKVPFAGFANQDNTHRWTQFTQIFLGDPSLDFWLDVPKSLVVTHPPTFDLGSGTYSVTVTESGSPVENATVTLYKDDDAYAVALTDVTGQVALPFTPDETGTFSVGVYSKGAVPYIGNATVTAPVSAAYLFAQSQTIVDDGSGLSDGNADGRIDSGETVELSLTLKNTGTITDSGILGTLSTSDPNLTISDGSSSFGAVAAGSTVTATDPFVVQVDRGALDRLEAKCTLTLTGSSGVYVEEVILYVHAPIFEYRLQAVRDSVGNGNNNDVITAGEDFAIIPNIRNIGLGTARSLEARLRSTDPAVTITDSVAVLGDLAQSAVVVGNTDAFAAQLSDVASEHEMTVVVLDAYGEVWSQVVDILPPGSVNNMIGFGAATSIALKWDPVADADLWGYNIYRGPSDTGPFARINTWTARRTSFYVDTNLPALTRYYYVVAAVDSAGNEGIASVVTSATTSLPLHSNWPVEVLVPTTGGITLADLDNDGKTEIIGGAEEIYVITEDGQDFYDGDQDVRTLGPLTNTSGAEFWNTPAVGDLDGDGVPELAGVGKIDEMIHVVDTQGVPLPGWPKDINVQGIGDLNPLGSVAFSDIDADGDLEVFCISGRVMYAWHHDGTELVDGDSNPGTDGVVLITGSSFSYGTPTLANIDAEPYKEIIFGMRDGNLYVYNHDGTPYPGFPLVTAGDITSSPAVGDIDLDGKMEIVFGSSDTKLYAIRADLTSAAGFPTGVLLNGDVDSSPALGDIIGDGRLDVAIGASNGQLKVFSGLTGIELPGFPAFVKDALGNPVEIRSSPTLADVDNDGFLDIVIGDQLGRVHCFDKSGVYLPGFPIQTGNLIENSPAIGDPDNDGLTEIIVESFDQKIYLFDTPWTFNPALAVWPMFKGNARNTGVYDEATPTTVGVPDSQGGRQAMLLQNYPNPFHLATKISYRVPTGETFRGVELGVFDINGREVRTLVGGEQPPGLHEISWDGRDGLGREVASGIYAYRLKVAGETVTRKLILMR